MTPATQQQPEPRPGGVSVTDLVISDLWMGGVRNPQPLVHAFKERRKLGIERYQTELRANNGRDALTDAYQEGLDKALYLRQALYEGCASLEQQRALDRLYRMELITLEEMAEMLHERERP